MEIFTSVLTSSLVIFNAILELFQGVFYITGTIFFIKLMRKEVKKQ